MVFLTRFRFVTLSVTLAGCVLPSRFIGRTGPSGRQNQAREVQMKNFRNTIVSATIMTGLTAALAVSASAQTVLKFATFVPPKYVLQKPIFEKMANDVASTTDGKLKIRIYPSGALGKGPVQQYDRAVKGIADISMGVTGYTSSLFQKTLLIELPGVARNGIDATRKMWRVMGKHLASEYRGTHVLASYATASSVLFTSKKPVRTLADLKGMKIRTPSRSAGEVLGAYGASPVTMPANKLYTAMSTGVIDGVLTGPSSLLIFKLIEPTKYVTVNIPEMPFALFIVMNGKRWATLPADQKQALTKASGEKLSVLAAGKLESFGKLALKLFAKRKGKEIIRVSDAERRKFDRAAAKARAKIVADLEKQGIPAGQVIKDMK